MQEAVLRVRLYKDIDLHNELLNKINSLPRSYKAEYLRNCLLLGDSVLRGQSPLPVPASAPAGASVNQPPAQQPQAEPTIPHSLVTAAPEQEVDQTPAISSLDHREKEAPKHTATTESDSMDAADPLAKMKNKFKGKGE